MADWLFNNWKLYCWPGLLFVAEKGIWNGAGFNDINIFTMQVDDMRKLRATSTLSQH
jgi:hypothetical protein